MKLLILTLLFTPTFVFSKGLSEASSAPEVTTVSKASDNSFNLKLNALSLLFGLGELSLEYKINPHFTISGALIAGKFSQESVNKIYKFDIKTFGGHLRTHYYFNEAFTDSFYLSALIGVLDFDVELVNSPLDASSSFSSVYIGANTGYAWHWENFNLNLGIGYNHSFEDEDAEIKINNIVGTTTVRVQYNLILEAALGFSF